MKKNGIAIYVGDWSTDNQDNLKKAEIWCAFPGEKYVDAIGFVEELLYGDFEVSFSDHKRKKHMIYVEAINIHSVELTIWSLLNACLEDSK